jgi:Kef-type K+ transport system membrane component KefB
MQSMLIIGVIIFVGFVFGELATKLKLPKVTGYLLAGIVLNPGILPLIPQDFVNHTGLITNIALSFITFSVGGTLLLSKLKKLGKGMIYITLFEAEIAFLAVVVVFMLFAPLLLKIGGNSWLVIFLPMSLLIGSLASPTDPTATLAVIHEYKAKGDVSTTIMGVAAFDDALGIINYGLAVTIARTLILHQGFSMYSSVLNPVVMIVGSVILGTVSGFGFNFVTSFMKKETEGAFIVVILALLSLCFGVAKIIGVDELLATMVMGICVVNFNPKRELIFRILERYTEELIFVLFFTISGMHLKFSVLITAYTAIVIFVVFRFLGKFSGTMLGANLAHAPLKVKKYTVGGLLPQGGIVIGLALMMKQIQAFDLISDVIISVIIGATVIHELIGPIVAKYVLRKAGEIGN